MEVSTANTFTVQLVQVWCVQNRIAQAGEIAVALVIGQDENHVGFGRVAHWIPPKSGGSLQVERVSTVKHNILFCQIKQETPCCQTPASVT